MNSSRPLRYLVCAILIAGISIPSSLWGQANFLKKYAGSYYLLAIGTDGPAAHSEKIVLTADGKWSSVSFPLDENEEPSKVAVKRAGTWKASDGVIQILSAKNNKPEVVEYKLDFGLFISDNTWLDPIFISDPAYLKKYSGAYYVLKEGQEKPAPYTRTVKLAGDGTCTVLTPTIDDNGVAGKATVEKSTWKAREASLQLFLKEDEDNKPTAFELRDSFFRSNNDYYLKKVPPPPPPNQYLKLYAGTYYMLGDGEAINNETDKYEFMPDGKATWTIYVRKLADGTVNREPFIRYGTWQPGAGYIKFFFAIEDFDMGDIPASYFKLVDGVFRFEDIILKKAPATTPGK